MNQYILILLLFFCTCVESKKETTEVSSLPYFNSPDFTPNWEKGKHKIPQFSFVNQDGVAITNSTYKGKIYIADFFFPTCPGICPKLTKNMHGLQDTYANENNIMLLSHTVMPWVDNVDKLKTYQIENDINSDKWNLVTGDKDVLYNIARNGYFADEDFTKTQDVNEFIHTENFILVDAEGYIRGVYKGTLEVEVETLKSHVDILKKEI
jgi:protein SCO1/2